MNEIVKDQDGLLIVVSPHFDDAVFSVGNILSQIKRPIKIITVCGGCPPNEVSLSSWDERCNFSSGKHAAIGRQTEDQNACHYLGVDSEHLLFADFPYSGEKSKTQIINEFKELLTNSQEVWAPIGIGNNPDHIVTRDAVLELALQGNFALALYADAPYASARGWNTPDDKRDKNFQWAHSFDAVSEKGFTLAPPHISFLNQDEMSRKLTAVACYKSQLEPLRKYYPKLTEIDGELSVEAIWRCVIRK